MYVKLNMQHAYEQPFGRFVQKSIQLRSSKKSGRVMQSLKMLHLEQPQYGLNVEWSRMKGLIFEMVRAKAETA